ncbi:MAG TPA: DUF5615 family PIN-like protein [Nordella sp.]|nr:DUF5615 family PIN-like protein [Nordella sp.]
MKFLIDECLHTSLVAIAHERGHDAKHVNWLGLSGQTDWNLMRRIVKDSFTFVTNNARDFRKLYKRESVHAGLIVIVPQVPPALQCELFDELLKQLDFDEPTNEIIEISIEEGRASFVWHV